MAGMYGCFKRNSESSAMASGPPDVMANQEAAEATEECSGKKKSKFQTFKKFFARKKRKEPSASGADAALKGSQSTDNISKTSENNTLTQSEKEKGSGSKISLGSKALSHDSVFVSDSSEANEALGASQDSIHGKVKSLQLQLKQAIRLGSPPSLMCVKGTEDMGTMSEDDGLPCSPPEYTAHTALAQVQGNSSISLEGTDSDEDQLSCAASSRAVSPLVVVPGDFSQPASPFACLDNSAAKHKMGLRHKACNKRKPASRLELKAEEDSVVEDILNSSISEAVEENNEQKIRDASADEYKPEEKEEEEEEEQDQAEHSRQSLLSDKTEKEESSSEPEAEQDVSDGPDTSCPPEMGLSEEEATDAWPLASSETGSRASSVDSPRGTPEPPAGQIEYLMDPPGTTYGTEEKRDQSDSVLGLTGGEDGEQETEEEESSLLQEVLSSLKTPLNSPLVETESIVLEMEQEEAKNGEEEKEDEEEEEKKSETEEGEEVKEEDGEEPVLYQAVVSGSSISDQNTKEEEEEVTTTTASYNDAQEEMKHVKEEEEDDSTEEEEEDEEEELVVEHFSQNDQVEEVEKEDVVKTEAEEENSLPATQTDNQVEEEGEEKKTEEEKEEEEEAKELEQEPETKAEKLEKTVEDNKEDGLEVEEKNEEVEESEEANEDEKDVQEKMFSEADGGEMVVDPEETVDDFNAINKDETEYEKDGDKILPGQEEEVFDMVHESQKAFDQMELKEQNLDQEKDTGATEPNMEEDGSEQDEEQESIEVLPQETKQEEVQSDVDTTVSSRPSSLTLPETPTTPSKTSTIHINLVSPSAENFASCFQLPPSTVEAKESLSTAEEPGDKVEKAAAEEEAKQPCDAATATDKEAKLSSPIDETSKVRFTIIPAWQRSLSIGEKDSSALPSSPPASVSSSPATGGMEVATMEERLEKAELASSAKAEVVLSPSRAKNAEMTTTKPQWNTSPPPESSAVVEGNPNNPFGVRLRKTSALHRFSSEEENAEPVHESAPQPSSCTADAPQPLSAKPSVSQPISNKPALPKKPEVMGDGGGKTKWILDPTAARGGSDPPSWISVAKQKQKVYKENSADNTAVQKEEQERRSSLPTNSSSNKTPESSSKVSPLELNKSSASAEKESRRSLSPPTPVPPQPTKSLSPPFPVPPKPHVTTSITPKPSPQRSLSPPTPVPVAHRPPSCTSPPSTSKPPPSLPTGNMTLTSPPFSSPRTTPAQSAGSSPTPAAQRGVPSPALTQDEPPWMALAKKKAKAWSEMPQIVQ